MATSPSAITPPAGYTLEQSQSSAPTPPPGYTIEGQPPAKPTGPTISATPQASDMTDVGMRSLPESLGGGALSPLTMPLVKALIGLHDKLSDAANLTQEGRAAHPIQAKIGDLANQIEGLLTGSTGHGENIGTGKYGVLTNPVTAGLIPGAEGTPVAAEAIEGGVSALKSGASAIKEEVSGGGEAADAATHVFDPATKKISPIQQVLKGEKVAQGPAQTALRTAAGTETGGVRTLLDEPIAAVAKAERATYDALNKASGTDLKSLYDHAEEVQDALDDPTNIAQKSSLQAELKTTQDQIAQGEANATKNGVDPSVLEKAKGLTQERYAKQALKQKLFNNEGVVKGNVAHGVDETINVDAAIRQVENLDKPGRFAPEGAPTRLQQALGSDGAAKLKQGLYDAQKAGKVALSRQELAKKIGIALGASGIGADILRRVVSR